MTTKSLASPADDLRSEYDLASLTGRVRGKYHARATAGTTLVLLEPDVAEAFPNGSSVNAALRAYLQVEHNGRGKLADKRLEPTTARGRARKRAGRAR